MTVPINPISSRRPLMVGETEPPVSQDEVKGRFLSELRRVVNRVNPPGTPWEKCRRPTADEVDARCRYRTETYVQYFGSLDAALDRIGVPRLTPETAPNLAPADAPAPAAVSAEAAWQRLSPLIAGRSVQTAPRSAKPPDARAMDWRQARLVRAREQGIIPRTPPEEAVVFDVLGEQRRYLRENPITLETMNALIEQGGSDALIRMWDIRRQMQPGAKLPERPPLLALQLVWTRSGRKNTFRDGPLKHISLDIHTRNLVNSEQAAATVFKWNPAKGCYIPCEAHRKPAMEIIYAFLRHYGADVSHLVENSMLHHAVGYVSRERHSTDVFLEYFRTHGGHAIMRLFAIARQLDARFKEPTRLVRLSAFLYADSFSGLQLEPWDADRGLENNHHLAQWLFENRGVTWRLVRYAGQYASDLVDAMDGAPKAPAPWRMTGQDNVRLTWKELRDTMASPALRTALFRTLGQRDFSKRIPPPRFVLLVQKGVPNDDHHVHGMSLFAVGDGESLDLRPGYSKLLFERDAGGRHRLAAIRGVGSGDLAESVLGGDGMTWDGPLERALTLRLLSDGNIFAGANGSYLIRISDMMNYFTRHGNGTAARWVRLLQGVRQGSPKGPEHLALTGLHREGADPIVDGLRLIHDHGVAKGPRDKRYFWTQFDLRPDGSYEVSPYSQRSLGRHLAAIARGESLTLPVQVVEIPAETNIGGQDIAPDADEMERVRHVVEKTLHESYGDADAVKPPPPMTTPLEPPMTPREIALPGREIVPMDRRSFATVFPWLPEDLVRLLRKLPASEGRLHSPVSSPLPLGEGGGEGAVQVTEDPCLVRMRAEISDAVKIASFAYGVIQVMRDGAVVVGAGLRSVASGLGTATAAGATLLAPAMQFYRSRTGTPDEG